MGDRRNWSVALLLASALTAVPAAADDGADPASDGSGNCTQRLCYPAAISPFLGKLRADPRKAHAPVHIIQIGDSHTAGDMITNGWRVQLQARYGNGGRGVLAAGKPYPGYLTWGVTASQSSGWTVNANFGKQYYEYGPALGISGFTQSTASAGERLGISTDSPEQNFDRITVCAMTGPGAGEVRLRMGFMAEENWSLKAPERKPACHSMQTGMLVNSAEITTLDEGVVSITSFGTFRNDGGVILSNLGVVGSQAIHLNREDDAVMRAEFAAYEPDLIVLAFGTNEGFSASMTADSYEGDLRRQVQRIRRLAGVGVPIMLLGAPDAATRNAALSPRYDCGDGLGPPRLLGEIRERQIKVARDMKLGFWNWAAAMGPECSAYAWHSAGQMRGDYVHFTRVGGERVGQMLAADITRAALNVRPVTLRSRISLPTIPSPIAPGSLQPKPQPRSATPEDQVPPSEANPR